MLPMRTTTRASVSASANPYEGDLAVAARILSAKAADHLAPTFGITFTVILTVQAILGACFYTWQCFQLWRGKSRTPESSASQWLTPHE